MTVEDLFNLGMSYVDTPLAEGYAKLLVNFDLKNQGVSLVPRGGIKLVDAKLANYIMPDTNVYAIHHVGSTLIATADDEDATVHKYVLIAPIVNHAVSGKLCYSFNQAYVIIETDTGYQSAVLSTAYYSNVKLKLNSIHNMDVALTSECNKGIYASIAANTYIPVFDINSINRKFVQLYLHYNGDGSIAATLPELVAKEIPASQTINSGYNMMKADPYTFQNTENATGGIVLGGIVPKDVNGKLKLTSNVGEFIRYHLNYSYPTADLTKQYLVQWEVADATTGATTQVLQQVRRSPVYTPGADIYLDYIVGYKQYTVVVKVYYKATVDAHTYVSDEDDSKLVIPEKVITVSSYTATSASKTNTNLTAKKYDLTTCTDMCVWQQRTVTWGVKDAATTLFVSQPNMPEYVAYPNDVEVFNEDVVTCVAYLDYLLVFTTNKLYKLSLTTDGTSVYYTTRCIQEHLPMTKEDATTIQIVKNMVYFKSNNYFYMIVPNSSAGTGELQLAPISNPVNGMLDTFPTVLPNIIDSVYNISHKFDLAEGAEDYYDISLVDYTNYMDGNAVRNVYKCKLNIYKAGTLNSSYYLDFVLNYDTVLRAWTSYLYESTVFRMIPYQHTVTQGMELVALQFSSTADHSVAVSTFSFDVSRPKDCANLTLAAAPRTFSNYQLIDTGYRAHYTAYKKRFREIQFTLNNTSQSALHFYTDFTVDDDVRKNLFEHNVQQITDPESPDYGLIYIERTLTDSIDIPGVVFFTDAGWTLDFSKFPTLTVSKARYHVSGKGYCGKMKLLSNNEELYELLSIHWVYRKMNAR